MIVRHLVRFSLLAFLLPACKPTAAPPPPVVAAPEPLAPPTLLEVTNDIFEAWFAARPVTATAMGAHGHDTQWPDLSAEALQRDRERIEAGLTALDEAAAHVASVDEHADVAILRAELRRQVFEHEVEQPWRRDPMWYAQMIGAGLDDLVSRDFAPLADRATSVAARLEGLPRFLEQARANLDPEACMHPQTELALVQLEGVLVLIEQVIDERTSHAPEATRQRIAAARARATESLRTFRAHVEATILPVAAGHV